ncbi:LacI family DNA-binding transcriptional regulator [Saccharothrix coeruleofusca]|uniref:LacI family transcriptional regulator n=1 Tax=Saccharothrix coeruleofusca TaxID=33919 RepID=A0A918AQS0_9PSEU|nr:LacI family DNA-binding transcriptional regulator [Saccharothrix coeruleofusca]MBP2337948.1 LacI family transcriptional regulator [Saccharothrix coeruleofusca]GGP63273.1 LacI family transcriptional regulator [Saccharothrix coeruleofusca]
MALRQVTLAEVAQHAGVSLATASRVLNGSTRQVSDELRTRVLGSADELGYLPNAPAQALARNSSALLGLVVHDISDPYFSSIAAGVSRVAEAAGLVVVLGTTGRDPDREVELVHTLRAHRARALVIAGSRTADRAATARLAEELRAFTAQGGRVACVSQARLGTDTVVAGNRAGARALARELAALGHRRFAVLGGPPDLLVARDRVAGFRAGLADAGLALPDRNVVHGGFTRDGGYAAVADLLAARTRATCVFVVNDVMATGAVAALRERGVVVPDDVSVAGFDDIPTLRDLVPALSTVRLPLEEMGERAARLVLDEEHVTPRTIRVAGEVVLRASTSSPGGTGLR